MYWPLDLERVPERTRYPDAPSDLYKRHQIGGQEVYLFLPVGMKLEDVPAEIMDRIQGD